MSDSNRAPINLLALQDSYGGDQEFLSSLVRTALVEVQMLLPKMSSELAAENDAEVFRLAHTIKGSARAVFATELQNVACEVERFAKSGGLPSVEKTLPVLLAEANRFGKAASEF